MIAWLPYASWAADAARAVLAYRVLRGEWIPMAHWMPGRTGVGGVVWRKAA